MHESRLDLRNRLAKFVTRCAFVMFALCSLRAETSHLPTPASAERDAHTRRLPARRIARGGVRCGGSVEAAPAHRRS